jgi:POT family proton-dependent oligopeptide transporter
MSWSAAWIPLILIPVVVARCLYDMIRYRGRFNRTFWAAIITELLHCLASYCMLAYLIVYLAQDLGFGDIRAGFLVGIMWFMGYFLPILIGAMADRYGFRETMVVSLVIITAGYFLASRVTSYPAMFAALMTIALGGAVMKPVIAGTVKAASAEEDRTLGFSIYYMVINVGSFIAPFLANFVRIQTGHPALIFVACGVVEAAALAVTIWMFKNIPVAEEAQSKSLITVLNDMVVVLGNLRLMITAAGLALLVMARDRIGLAGDGLWVAALFWIALNVIWDLYGPMVASQWGVRKGHPLFDRQRIGDGKLLAFIVIFSGVWALYSQIWTNIPLFITRIDPAMKAHIEYFQAVDPIMIVFFQVLVGKAMSRYRPLPSMVVGILIASVAVASVGPFGHLLGAWAVGISLVIWAVGEMMFSPRMVEYVSVIAPKDKLALYIGYGFLPFAIGFGVGPSTGAHLVHFFESVGRPDWVWYGLGLWSLLVAGALMVYDRVVNKKEES